jgi:hypothetical protein
MASSKFPSSIAPNHFIFIEIYKLSEKNLQHWQQSRVASPPRTVSTSAQTVVMLSTTGQASFSCMTLNCNSDTFAGQTSHLYQLFVERDESKTMPSVQDLFEQSFLTSGIKLRKVPSVMILQVKLVLFSTI